MPAASCLPGAALSDIGTRMSPHEKDVLLAAIARLPDWIRKDLAAADTTVRTRAHEELTAMLVNALERGNGGGN